MIIEAVINLVVGLLKLAFGWISLPELPTQVQSVIDSLFGYMRAGLGIFAWFFDCSFIALLIPVVVVVVNFDKLYKLTMFILRKLPIGVK